MPISEAIGRVAARLLVTAVLLAAVILLGQVPWGSSTGEAVLRLALRTVQGKLEVCRPLTEEELAALPVHMRRETECEAHPVIYRLRVELDGEQRIDEVVEPGGLRHDRPHNVDRELVLPAGEIELEVSFVPELPDGEAPEVIEAFAELPRYVLHRPVRLEADRVTLVHLDDTAGRLEIVGG